MADQGGAPAFGSKDLNLKPLQDPKRKPPTNDDEDELQTESPSRKERRLMKAKSADDERLVHIGLRSLTWKWGAEGAYAATDRLQRQDDEGESREMFGTGDLSLESLRALVCAGHNESLELLIDGIDGPLAIGNAEHWKTAMEALELSILDHEARGTRLWSIWVEKATKDVDMKNVDDPEEEDVTNGMQEEDWARACKFFCHNPTDRRACARVMPAGFRKALGLRSMYRVFRALDYAMGRPRDPCSTPEEDCSYEDYLAVTAIMALAQRSEHDVTARMDKHGGPGDADCLLEHPLGIQCACRMGSLTRAIASKAIHGPHLIVAPDARSRDCWVSKAKLLWQAEEAQPPPPGLQLSPLVFIPTVWRDGLLDFECPEGAVLANGGRSMLAECMRKEFDYTADPGEPVPQDPWTATLYDMKQLRPEAIIPVVHGQRWLKWRMVEPTQHVIITTAADLATDEFASRFSDIFTVAWKRASDRGVVVGLRLQVTNLLLPSTILMPPTAGTGDQVWVSARAVAERLCLGRTKTAKVAIAGDWGNPSVVDNARKLGIREVVEDLDKVATTDEMDTGD